MDPIESDDDIPLPPAAFISRSKSHPHSSGPSLFLKESSNELYDHKYPFNSEQVIEVMPEGQSRLREIITDQASEISRLKKLNAKLTEDIQNKIAYMQCDLQDKNLEILSERDEIQRRLEEMNKEHSLNYKELQKEREEIEENYQQCIAQLQNELEKLAADSHAAISHLEKDMQVKQSEIKSLTSHLTQLRRLLTEMDTAGGWEHLHSNLICKQNELTNIIKDLETKLKAAQELVDIDLECKVKDDPEKPLDAWRRAVLKLLIQQESLKITFKRTLAEKDDSLLAAKNQSNDSFMEISSLKEKVVMLNAQVNLERKRSKDLKDRKQQSDSKIAQLTSQLESQESSLRNLIPKCTALMSRTSLSEGDMADACARLRQMEHRVESLSSQLPLIRAQWTRHAAKNRERREELHSEEDVVTQEAVRKDKEKLRELEENVLFCRHELEKARNDRNQLIYQLEEENKSFQSRVDKAKEAVADEMNSLHSTVKSLESRLDQVQEQLYDREEELAQLQSQNEHLKTNQSETISQLEESLRKAKRDYAEAMLSLRQNERQCESEKEMNREKIRKLEDSQESIVKQLHQEVNQLKAECNIMKTSLRQEGLLATHTFQYSQGAPLNINPDSTNYKKKISPPTTLERPLNHKYDFASNDTSDDTNLSIVIQEVTDLAQGLSQSDDEF